MSEQSREPRLKISERPDLRAEREAWVRNVLRKGVEFTEELLREHHELVQDCLRLEQENARLRSQIASDDAIRDLLTRIDALEQERRSLLDRSNELEVSKHQYEGRSHQVEHELNDLASLYVASYQLSGCSAPARAVEQVAELLEQLVGAERFVLYVVDGDGRQALPIAWYGYGEKRPRAESLAEGLLSDVCLTGVAKIQDNPKAAPPGVPLAVLPLMYGGTVVGLIALERFLSHKEDWASVDHEMFKVLSSLGATVLVASSLYEKAGAPRAVLSPLTETLWSEPKKQSRGSDVRGMGA